MEETKEEEDDEEDDDVCVEDFSANEPLFNVNYDVIDSNENKTVEENYKTNDDVNNDNTIGINNTVDNDLNNNEFVENDQHVKITNVIPGNKKVLKGKHWVSLFIGETTIEYFDSFGCDPPNELNDVINNLSIKLNLKIFIYSNIKQTGGIECGMYCSWYGYQKIKKQSFIQIEENDVNDIDMKMLRSTYMEKGYSFTKDKDDFKVLENYEKLHDYHIYEIVNSFIEEEDSKIQLLGPYSINDCETMTNNILKKKLTKTSRIIKMDIITFICI